MYYIRYELVLCSKNPHIFLKFLNKSAFSLKISIEDPKKEEPA